MYNGRKTCTRTLKQTAFLGAIAFLFSDNGIYFFYSFELYTILFILIMIEYGFELII